jgi:hypothetical protein
MKLEKDGKDLKDAKEQRDAPLKNGGKDNSDKALDLTLPEPKDTNRDFDEAKIFIDTGDLSGKQDKDGKDFKDQKDDPDLHGPTLIDPFASFAADPRGRPGNHQLAALLAALADLTARVAELERQSAAGTTAPQPFIAGDLRPDLPGGPRYQQDPAALRQRMRAGDRDAKFSYDGLSHS